jgi:DNA-binding XRE family transcriptional regulator
MTKRRAAFVARRKACGFSQESFAQALGVELTTAGRWERGQVTPQPWRRARIAELLDVSRDELESLLHPVGPVDQPLVSRREVMVDAAMLTGATMVDHVLGKPSQPSGSPVATAVARVHADYQAARYGHVAQVLPMVASSVESLIHEGPGSQRRDALRLRCSLSIAKAKLANKTGDSDTATAAAATALSAADAADDEFGRAAAAHQMTCALISSGEHDEAERLAVASAEAIRGRDPESLSWRGALILISAIVAARRNDLAESTRRLDHAEDLADQLGADGNFGWTAFGPTNVQIHRLSAAVDLGDPYRSLAMAEYIDITGLPVGLRGRQAQYHLDSAWAHVQLGEDSRAVIHLLETERVADELVRANPNARALIQDLLAREHRRTVPGLRGLAMRTGVAA